MKSSRRGKGDDGFTLIETIVAITIFSISFVALYYGMSVAWRSLRVSNAAADALSIAKAKLTAAGIEVPLEDGKQIDGDDNGVSWHLEMHRYDGSAASARPTASKLYWVQVDATWHDGASAEPNSLALSTVKLSREPQQ